MELDSKSGLDSFSRPRISVCIANYNGDGVIRRCIESVKNQTLTESIEIIVHDDASTDKSASQIKEYSDAILLESDRNVGYCESNNRMVAIAKGEYLLLLNNDATLYPDALSVLEGYARLYPNDILTLPQYSFSSGELLDTGMRVDMFCNPVPTTDSRTTHRAMAMGACLWIPRHVWDTCGGFPPWFESMAEDMYICFFARLCGYAVQCVPQSGYTHVVGHSFGGGKVIGSGLSSTYRRRALSERNKTFVMLLTYPVSVLVLVLPLHIISLIFECAVLCVAKRSWKPLEKIYLNIVKGVVTNWKNLCIARSTFLRVRRWTCLDVLSVTNLVPYKLSMLLKYGLPKLK